MGYLLFVGIVLFGAVGLAYGIFIIETRIIENDDE